ncbi:MAG: glycosyltransferase [Chloroflexi bacterium]|nr:MAG: glycosyltransferase [Chloroflexota bacterium]
MNIVMFSMTPLFADRAMGGAQIQLKKVALHLGQLGHDVTVLCTHPAGGGQAFEWGERVNVIPIFRFKQPYPEPYFTPIYNIANALQTMGDYLSQADRYYSHDGGLIFPGVYEHIPTVISLRSVLFAETLQSGYLFQGDALILPSEFARQCYIKTAGRFLDGYADRAIVIHNGLDFNKFKATDTQAIRAYLGLEGDYRYILFPHRPDEDKGILQTIELANKLVHEYGLKDIRFLVPRWMDEDVSPSTQAFYARLRGMLTQYDLEMYFVFHPWIAEDMMPAYYSLGALTLAIGNYVETFGNVPYESLACGTPVILANVGPAREILPDELVDKINYGDINTAAVIAHRILTNAERTSTACLSYLHQHLGQKQMVSQYADVILNAQKRPPMAYHYEPYTEQTRFQLAPWCYRTAQGIYHDFQATYYTDEIPVGYFTCDDVTKERVLSWVDMGLVVAV